MSKRRLITFDWALKRLLRSKANFEVLEGFLSELLDTDIKIIDILESESNKEDARDKSNRVDLKVRNSAGELILIELQYEREYDYLQRLLFGIAKTITEHVNQGEAYTKVPKVISINILYFDLGTGQDYIYVGATTFKGMHTQEELILSDTQKELFQRQTVQEIFPAIYLIVVKRFNAVARNSLDEWIYFLKTGEILEDFTARGLEKAKNILDILHLSGAERQAYEQFQESLRTQASMVENTWRAGKLEGKKEGLEEGRKEGLEEGRKEGLETGARIGQANLLTRQLQRRFGPLPDWATTRISQADTKALAVWSERIFDADSLDKLLTAQES
ncbi:MAG: Rpn family recombination-promoting nuclease/putative transposase [Magnetococcales bacterium]|nr:Rpn family recombination-promoting nuclease/putative transposase [Magnetococcales bacterium]NGZ04812.1 Rpn family recombination-promoting nuclease/putative transposase [Magnetococcales bacterium]